LLQLKENELCSMIVVTFDADDHFESAELY